MVCLLLLLHRNVTFLLASGIPIEVFCPSCSGKGSSEKRKSSERFTVVPGFALYNPTIKLHVTSSSPYIRSRLLFSLNLP